MRLRTSLVLAGAIVLWSGCQPAGDGREAGSAEERSAEELGEGATPDRPNIVLVIADDFGAPNHGFMGAEYMHSPNIDRLAEHGVVFPNGYAPANHCRPSLRTFATGLLPLQYDRLEVRNRSVHRASDEYLALSEEEREVWEDEYQFHSMRDVATLPRILSENGYLTWQGGKWWEFTYENGGFTHGMTTGWDPEDRDDEGWFLQFMGGQGRELARVSNEAAYEFVEEAGERPFFMWYAPELPHYPFDAPQEYLDLYAGDEFTESARLYYANASWLDDRLGEFFEFLDARGKLENTLIVYVNDNGWEQEPEQEFAGDEMRFHNGGDKGKLSMYDQSFRTPIIFTWPGRLEGGQVRGDLIHGADIPATILDYVGLEEPEGLYGRSYRGVIEGSSSDGRDEIVGRATQVRWEGDMMGRRMNGYWLRRGPWFFNWDVDSGTTQLYNVLDDPRSERDRSVENQRLVEEFQHRIDAWRAAYEQ
jgi:uncharacterized sulfatase